MSSEGEMVGAKKPAIGREVRKDFLWYWGETESQWEKWGQGEKMRWQKTAAENIQEEVGTGS